MKKILLRKKLLKSLLLCASVSIAGCSGSGGGGSGNVNDNIVPSSLENPVRLDSLGVIPASDTNTASYLLRISNYSDNKYTLDSVKIVDLDTGKESKLVSVVGGLCALVPSNGSCSLQLAPHTQKSADVKLEVTLKDSRGTLSKLYQLVRVSGKLKANNGGIVMLNDVGQIMSEDGNYGLSIPVVLGETFDEIRASNGTIVCNTAGYLKGSSCTYQVRGKAGKNGAAVSTRLEGIRNGKVVAYSEETTTNVTPGRGAYLLLSHGKAIDTPESTGTVRVFNSGNSIANGVTTAITPQTSGLKLVDDNCDNLAAGDICNVNLSVSGTQNGQGTVEVSYSDEVAGAQRAATNVSYTVASAVAGVGFRTESSNLNGAILGGKSRGAVVTISNTSNRGLENVRLYLTQASSEFGLDPVEGDEGCSGLTGLTLAAGASCKVQITYTPTTEQEQSSINLVLNGEYLDENGQRYSIVSGHGLNYAASEVNDSTLSWNVLSENRNLTTLNNGVDIGTANWSLVNTLEADEGLSATLTSEVTFESAPTALAVRLMDGMAEGSCGAGHELNGQESCNYTVAYGTVAPGVTEDRTVGMAVDYTLNEKELTSATEFKVIATDSVFPSIRLTVREESAATFDLDGLGTTASPWSFTASSGNNLKLLYTYTNVGINTAFKFNVDAGNLPAGAQVVDSNCPYGLVTDKLTGGSECTITVQVPDPRVFKAPNIMGVGAIQLSDMTMGVSYYDESRNRMEHVPEPSGVRANVNYNRQWGALSTGTIVWFESATAYTAHVPVNVEVAKNSGLVSYPIKVNVNLPTAVDGVTHTTCEVTQGHTECDKPVEISLPKSLFNSAESMLVAIDAAYAGAPESDVLRLVTDLTAEAVTQVTLAAPRLTPDSAEFVESVKSEGTGTVEITVTNPNTQPVHVVVGDVPAKYTVDAGGCTAKAYLGANASCKLKVNYDGTEENEAGTAASLAITLDQANIPGSEVHSTPANLQLLTRPRYVEFITKSRYRGDFGVTSKPAESDIYDWVRHLCTSDESAPAVHTRNGLIFAPVLNLDSSNSTIPVATRSAVFTPYTNVYHKLANGTYERYLGPVTDIKYGVSFGAARTGMSLTNTSITNTLWHGHSDGYGAAENCRGWTSGSQSDRGATSYNAPGYGGYYYITFPGNLGKLNCGWDLSVQCVAQ